MKLHIYNPTLDLSIWNEDKTLKPDIQEHLIKIAEDFYNSTDLEGEVHNILFIGSSANYNWTPTSDIDLHIVIDIATEKINEEYARKFMDSLSFKWNTEHEIEIKGHPVEVYLQDMREPNSDASKGRPGNSIYSLIDGKWLIEPKREVPQVDAEKVRQKYQVIKKKIKNLVDDGDISKLKDLMKSIRNYRNAGLSNGGEFSVENLVFKALRKGGDLEKIKTTINTIYDKQSSLPENGNFQPDKKTTPMNENKSNKNFLIVGIVNDDLDVNSEIDYTGKGEQNCITHFNHFGYKSYHSILWRYKSKDNTLYWWICKIDLNNNEIESVLHHLEKKYGIINPKQSTDVTLYIRNAHKINETLVNKN